MISMEKRNTEIYSVASAAQKRDGQRKKKLSYKETQFFASDGSKAFALPHTCWSSFLCTSMSIVSLRRATVAPLQRSAVHPATGPAEWSLLLSRVRTNGVENGDHGEAVHRSQR